MQLHKSCQRVEVDSWGGTVPLSVPVFPVSNVTGNGKLTCSVYNLSSFWLHGERFVCITLYDTHKKLMHRKSLQTFQQYPSPFRSWCQ